MSQSSEIYLKIRENIKDKSDEIVSKIYHDRFIGMKKKNSGTNLMKPKINISMTIN